MLIYEINNKEVRIELWEIFNKLCEIENNPFYNPKNDMKKTIKYIIKLEEEKETLISDLMKLQNELNYYKTIKEYIDMYNKIKSEIIKGGELL